VTENQALKLALEALKEHEGNYKLGKSGCERQEKALTAIKEALTQPPEPRNFCPRCGKRTADLTVIHTCTPPRGLEMT